MSSGFINLHEESLYLQGARDILLRLKDDFEMYLVPSVKCKTKPSPYLPNGEADYCWFALQNSAMRRQVGKSLLNALINDRESLNRFLQGDYEALQVDGVTRDKKGKITELKIGVV